MDSTTLTSPYGEYDVSYPYPMLKNLTEEETKMNTEINYMYDSIFVSFRNISLREIEDGIVDYSFLDKWFTRRLTLWTQFESPSCFGDRYVHTLGSHIALDEYFFVKLINYLHSHGWLNNTDTTFLHHVTYVFNMKSWDVLSYCMFEFFDPTTISAYREQSTDATIMHRILNQLVSIPYNFMIRLITLLKMHDFDFSTVAKSEVDGHHYSLVDLAIHQESLFYIEFFMENGSKFTYVDHRSADNIQNLVLKNLSNVYADEKIDETVAKKIRYDTVNIITVALDNGYDLTHRDSDGKNLYDYIVYYGDHLKTHYRTLYNKLICHPRFESYKSP